MVRTADALQAEADALAGLAEALTGPPGALVRRIHAVACALAHADACGITLDAAGSPSVPHGDASFLPFAGGTLWATSRPGRAFDADDLRLLGTLAHFAAVAVRDPEARFHKAIGIDTVGVVFFSLDGKVSDANTAYQRMSGMDLSFLRAGVPWSDISPPEIADIGPRVARELATTGETRPYELKLRRPDRSFWWGLFAPTRLSGHGVTSECVAFVVDITETKRREAQTRLLDQIAGEIAKLETADAILRAVGAQVGPFLGISSCIYGDFDWRANEVVIHSMWNDAEVPSLVDRTFRLGDYYSDELLRAFRSGKIIAVPDVTTDPQTANGPFAAIAVGAVVVLPCVVVAGEVKATFTITNARARAWRPDEIDFLGEVAKRMAWRLERARAELALRLREEEFRTLFESIDEAFALCEIVVDDSGRAVDTRILVVNPAWERTTGIDGAKARGRTVRDFVPQLESSWIEKFARVGLGRESFRFENHAADRDRWYDVYATPVGDRDGGKFAIVFSDVTQRKRTETVRRATEARQALLLGLSDRLRSLVDPQAIKAAAAEIAGSHLGVPGMSYAVLEGAEPPVHRRWTLDERLLLREVTERTWAAVERARAQAALRASELRYRNLVESVRDYAIFLLDADGNVTEWTAGAERVLGYFAAEVVGRHVSCFHAEEGFAAEVDLAEAAANGRAEREDWRVRKGGTRFWANEITTAIRDPRGILVGYSKIGRDLSRDVRLDRERDELLAAATAARALAEEANRSKDEFLATLSHELRTPLAPIFLWAQALRSGNVPAHDFGRALDAIVRSAHSQARLIEDLLDLSRLASGRLNLLPRAISVSAVASAAIEVVTPSASEKGISMRLEVGPDLGDAVLDAGRIQQVLWNLLSNAVKFTPSGGAVVLRVRRDVDSLEVVVTDTGKGIAADFLPSLFQRFHQADRGERRQHSGLGIGLALCRSLVDLHGGSLEARSEGPGRGATFIVRIPWIEPATTPVEEVAPPERPPATLRGLHVLLVEDDNPTRDVMKWTLERAGAHVVAAASGPEALDLLAPADASTPNLMVCDLGLPGMSGYDLIERVVIERRARGQPPICACAVSAHAREVDRRRAIEAGFDSYLTKPVTAAGLIAAVEELAIVAAGVDA